MDAPLSCQYEEILYRFRILFDKNYSLLDSDLELLMEHLTYNSAKRNTILLQSGEVEHRGRLVSCGIVKVTFDDSEPYVFDFRKDGDFLCDVVSLTQRTKSSFTFETITDCELVEINAFGLMQLNARISNVFSMTVVDHLKKGYERLAFLRISNAEERYMEFCKMHPEIIKYAKLGDIASYLEITPQSLSRIRKRTVRKQFNI